MTLFSKTATWVWCISCGIMLGQETHAQKSLRTCESVPVANIPTSHSVEILNSRFDSYNSDSISSILVRNRTTKNLTEALVLTEYLSQDEKHILTAIYYGRSGDVKTSSPHYLRGRAIQRLKEPILPERDFFLTFASDIVASVCPSKSRVTKILVTFDDGTQVSDSLPGWHTDPFIRDAQNTDLTRFPLPIPRSFSSTLMFNSRGRVAVVDVDGDDVRLKDWLQNQVDGWSLVQPEADPATDYQQFLTLLVRVHPNERELNSDWSGKERAPFVMIVDVVPSNGPDQKSMVLVGGVLATQRALSTPE